MSGGQLAVMWLSFAVSLATVIVAIVHAARATRGSMKLSLLLLVCNIGIGGSGTIYGLTQSFAAVGQVAPSEKATLLARGISEAMNCTAAAIAGTIAWAIPFIVGEVRRHRRVAAQRRAGQVKPASPSRST